jgi:hypothetical protein
MKRVIYAMAAIAIVSGALAFKAKKFDSPTVFCVPTSLSLPTTGTVCPAADLVHYIQDDSGFTTNPCTGTDIAAVNVAGTCTKSTAQAYSPNN